MSILVRDLLFGQKFGYKLTQGHRATYGSLRIVLARNRSAENTHDHVAHMLVDHTAVAEDRSVESTPQQVDLPQARRIASSAGQSSKAIDGGEQDCDCLLYTSDAADERSSVDLGGRRIIKKKKQVHTTKGREEEWSKENT